MNYDISIEQMQYIEIRSGAGMATTSRTVCKYCDAGRHNECLTAAECYCAKCGHLMV
jgi:hypothetical protein